MYFGHFRGGKEFNPHFDILSKFVRIPNNRNDATMQLLLANISMKLCQFTRIPNFFCQCVIFLKIILIGVLGIFRYTLHGYNCQINMYFLLSLNKIHDNYSSLITIKTSYIIPEN